MRQSDITWQPYREPLTATLTRTGAIALAVGLVLALSSGRPTRWPVAALLMLWPSFGGHWVELFFLNYLRPRLPSGRAIQAAVRIIVWFTGGIVLGIGVRLTAIGLTPRWPVHWPAWWLAGLGFIAIELLAHAAIQLRGRPSFFNGRG